MKSGSNMQFRKGVTGIPAERIAAILGPERSVKRFGTPGKEFWGAETRVFQVWRYVQERNPESFAVLACQTPEPRKAQVSAPQKTPELYIRRLFRVQQAARDIVQGAGWGFTGLSA